MATKKATTAPAEPTEEAATEQPTEQPPTEPEAPPAPVKRQGVKGVYYLVNPGGAVHGVDREHAAWRLKTAGWRLATEEEIATYLGQPLQVHDRPICQPWTPDPDKQLAALEG